MSNQSSGANSFALASRFLHAFLDLNKLLAATHLSSSYEHLNIAQLRILQFIHENPGIRAETVIDHLELAPEAAKNLILAMEKTGLLRLERSSADTAPTLRLGEHGQRLSFQIKATQLSILAELIDKLPETQQVATVEALEQLVQQHLQ